MKNILSIALAMAALFATPAGAEVRVDQPWVRATVATQKVTGAFMTLTSDKPMSLVSAVSPAAKTVEIHEMKMDMKSGVMSMQAVSSLAIVPGKPTELKPGGYHFMLFDLTKPLAAGDSVPLTLTFKDASGKMVTQEVRAEVRGLTDAAKK